MVVDKMANAAVQTLRDIEIATLKNGVRVISEEMSHVRSVSLGVWIRTGSRRETSEENGISHFIEHMLFKGTKNRSAEEIARSVDSIGGGLDAFTAKEMVSYNTKVLDEHLPIAFDVLADMVRNPLFREEDIEKEKGVILEELKMDVDNPEYLLHDIFSSNFYKDHPLGKPIIGSKDTIRGFDRLRFRTRAWFFATKVRSNRLTSTWGCQPIRFRTSCVSPAIRSILFWVAG
jgi:predicted Zn-dependent peptidase